LDLVLELEGSLMGHDILLKELVPLLPDRRDLLVVLA
jgi:hypothetical protein